MIDNDFQVIMILAGAGAAGKTTLAQAFAQGEPAEYKSVEDVMTKKGVRPMRGTYTLYENYAEVGNHHSGTDANGGPGIVRAMALKAIEHRDIINIDSYTSSPQWIDLCNEICEKHRLVTHVLFVTFDIPLEVVVARMAGRRGCTIADMYDPEVGGTIVKRIQSGMTRPARLLKHCHEKLDGPLLTEITIDHTMSVDDEVALLDDTLEQIFAIHGKDYYG